jgi:hypothetical protein
VHTFSEDGGGWLLPEMAGASFMDTRIVIRHGDECRESDNRKGVHGTPYNQRAFRGPDRFFLIFLAQTGE